LRAAILLSGHRHPHYTVNRIDRNLTVLLGRRKRRRVTAVASRQSDERLIG
jgi:hypothetical protein